ncbi:MAG TPA: lysophospholipid acyltransferase family protein, partial [Burkholderiales bacterium]|nr:lysophospholipid acyltransferase family protein [Burkholderiales bacterium]
MALGKQHAVRVIRLARLGIHLARGVLVVGTVFPYSGKARRRKMISRWSGKLLRILNVSLSVSGKPPEGESLLIANHVSWLDIYLLNVVCPPRFVAKSEIRKWPVVGWLSEKTGVLFVERERRSDAGRVNQAIYDAIASGDLVAIFPEGTTSDGSKILSFRAPLLEPALRSNANVHPAAIRYVTRSGEIDKNVAYVGDISFGQS